MQRMCFAINRIAQNGSRTALKMLTFAAMRCLEPRGDAGGFLVSGEQV